MEKKYQCEYQNPTTHRRCTDYAEAWLVLPEGTHIPVCEKHFASVKAMYESKYGKDDVKVQRRLMENADR